MVDKVKNRIEEIKNAIQQLVQQHSMLTGQLAEAENLLKWLEEDAAKPEDAVIIE